MTERNESFEMAENSKVTDCFFFFVCNYFHCLMSRES